MSKTIVIYYSNTGSNDYLANKVAKNLNCDSERIVPRFNVFPWLLLASKTILSAGIRAIKHNLKDYDKVILVGPIWVGSFVAPLYSFVKRYKKDIKSLSFLTCCGSFDDNKDDKYGYNTVFKKVKGILGDKLEHSEALSIALVLPEDKRKDPDTVMNTRLTDDNFNGTIKERYDKFINLVTDQQ